MSGEDECFNALIKLDKIKEMKEKDIRRIVTAVENIQALAGKGGTSFEEMMSREIEKIKMETVHEKLEKVSSAKKLKANIDLINQEIYKDRPMEAVMGLLNGVQTTAKGAVNSIAMRQEVMKETNSSRYFQGLLDLGKDVVEVMKTGAIDKDVRIENELMQNPASKLQSTGNAMAKKVAEIQFKMNQIMRMDIVRGLGHDIGTTLAYLTKQVHDREKVRGDGSDKAMQAWIDSILPRLDEDKTFGMKIASDPDLKQARLEQAWKHIVYGDAAFEARGRSLHLKDAIHEHDYNTEWGNKSLYEATLARVADNARIVAQMDVLGPDPRKGLDGILNHIEKKYRTGNPEVHKDFNNSLHKVENMMLEVEGYSSIPGDSMMANVGRANRAFNNLTYLANTGVRALGGNIPVLAMELKSSQGLNVLQTLNAGLQGITNRFALSISKDGIKNPLARETMLKTGMAMHDFHYGIASQFAEDTTTKGAVAQKVMRFLEMMSQHGIMEKQLQGAAREVGSKGVLGAMQKPFFHLTGLSYINDVDRATTARLMMNGVHEQAHLSFGELPQQFRANIERAGIDEASWKVLQMAGDTIEHNGMEVINPRKVGEINPKIIEQIMQEHKIKGDPAGFARDVEIKYGTYLWSAGKIATTTPDMRVSAFIKGGFREDQVQGQVRRLMGQFKSFTLFQSDIMTRFFTANPEQGARELSDIFKGKGSPAALAAYATSATMFYYMGEQMIRLGQGKELESPTPANLGKSFLKSGMGGVVFDFIDAQLPHGKENRVPGIEEGLKYAAGPTITRVGNIGLEAAFGAANLFRSSDKQFNLKSKVGSELTNMVPAQNFFLTRRAMEPLLLDPIREMLDPEYAYKKQIQKMKMGH